MMSNPPPLSPERGETTVDDVRRVRSRLAREADNDVQRLIEDANRVAGQLALKLGMKVHNTPSTLRAKEGANR